MNAKLENLTDKNRAEFLGIVDDLLDRYTFSENGRIVLTTDNGDDVKAYHKYHPILKDVDAIERRSDLADWPDGHGGLEARIYVRIDKLRELRGLLAGEESGNLDKVQAKLENTDDIPVVITQGHKYRLETLHSGLPLKIITYAYNNRHSRLDINSLKIATPHTSLTNPGANLTQVFRKNPFSVGVLKPFAKIGTKSIVFNWESDLTIQELETIKSTAISTS